MIKFFKHISAPAPRYMMRLVILYGLFKKHLPRTKFSAIEFGPGLGDICSYFNDLSNCVSIKAIDYSEKTIQYLSNRFSNNHEKLQYELGTIIETPLHKKIDILLAFEVLEHIKDDELSIKHLHQMLSSNGVLFISVPAYQKKWQKQDVYAGHYRRYERKELHTKLSSVGFSNIEIIDYGFPLTSIMYPFKQMAYRSDKEKSKTERTQNSGVERPLFSKIPTWLIIIAYFPFFILQWLFINRSLGDGFIVIAKKS